MSGIRKMVIGLALAIFALVVAPACGGSDDTSNDVSGTWNGTWTNTSPAYNGTITVTVLQEGTSLSGNGSLTGLPVVNTMQGPVTGTVNGNTVSGQVTGTGVQITFQLTQSGNTLSGTYNLTPGDYSGTMTITR